MNNDTTYYLDLIARYFSGEAEEQEIKILSEWLQEDKSNRSLFEEHSKIWQEMAKGVVAEKIDVDKEWREFQSKTGKDIDDTGAENIAETSTPIRRMMSPFARIAAVILLLIVSGMLIIYIAKSPSVDTIVAENEIVNTDLPDGSGITLQRGTSLSYSSDFNKKERRVNLEGEAYFDVSSDTSKPFVIAVNNIRIEVVGTSFFVNGNATEGNVEVVVTSGRVAVYFADSPNEKVILAAGERGITSVKDHKIRKTEIIDENFMSWKTKKIAFQDESLHNVITTISKVYNKNIVLTSEAVGNCRITASFDNQSFDAVLNVLEATLNVRIKKDKDVIEISGNGCQ